MYGEIWWIDFGEPFGSEAGYKRPALVVQNDILNSTKINTVIVAPITSNLALRDMSGNVFISGRSSGLKKDSVILVSQLVAADRQRFHEKVSKITAKSIINEINDGLSFVLNIDNPSNELFFAY
jgi:mRNA interferase MazF